MALKIRRLFLADALIIGALKLAPLDLVEGRRLHFFLCAYLRQRAINMERDLRKAGVAVESVPAPRSEFRVPSSTAGATNEYSGAIGAD